MRICLISVEIFAWGKYGGFGRAARMIGSELVKMGHEVAAVVPRRKGQQTIEYLDGIKVYGFPPLNPFSATRWLVQCDADIYHSCEPSFASFLAMKAMPHRKHMVTFRDPRNFQDWRMEFALPSLNKLQVLHNYFYENNILVRNCIARMDSVCTIGKYLVPKVKKMYRLKQDPVFLPTPVVVPKKIEKSATPMVCYVARLDRRKRPNLFMDLAEQFPDVYFIAIGKSRDKSWDRDLREKYGNVPNLELTGFVDQFRSSRHSQLLEQSWVMVNTATREALPNSFIEAAAHKCAILSAVDPDNFASNFGYAVKHNNFAEGLRFLLSGNCWKERGEAGYHHMQEVFEVDKSIKQHIRLYQSLLADKVPNSEVAAY